MQAPEWLRASLVAHERQDFNPTAITWCKKSRSFEPRIPARTAISHVIQSMAHYRLGEIESAQAELGRGREIIEAELAAGLSPGDTGSGFWFDWFFARILLREAETMIETP